MIINNSTLNKHYSPICVYLYDFSVATKDIKDCDYSDIFCKERKTEIEKTESSDEKKRKYFSWKLLQFALSERGINAKKQNLVCDNNGKWHTDGVCFSISHTKNVVAVAVSDNEVGIDIEKSDRAISKALFDKIACEAEIKAYPQPTVKDVLILWTKKEAIFKRNGDKVFIAKEINTLNENAKTIYSENGDIVISVSSTLPLNLKLFQINFLP